MKYLLLLFLLSGCVATPDYKVLFDEDVSTPDQFKPFEWGLAEQRYKTLSHN